ncbi:unnamed protein product [Lasius platythorax]|uniref:Uncharacterized protein n=1 Tax=Lasius platythorax TaxID=488582 RepID=A0AAV2P3K4_9HYME
MCVADAGTTYPGKLEMHRWCHIASRRSRRGDGNGSENDPRLGIGEEEEAKLGRREDATAFDDERTRKGTERRNAVYALSVIGGKGERPSMWRTCRRCRCYCCCSLPVERAGRLPRL